MYIPEQNQLILEIAQSLPEVVDTKWTYLLLEGELSGLTSCLTFVAVDEIGKEFDLKPPDRIGRKLIQLRDLMADDRGVWKKIVLTLSNQGELNVDFDYDSKFWWEE